VELQFGILRAPIFGVVGSIHQKTVAAWLEPGVGDPTGAIFGVQDDPILVHPFQFVPVVGLRGIDVVQGGEVQRDIVFMVRQIQLSGCRNGLIQHLVVFVKTIVSNLRVKEPQPGKKGFQVVVGK